MERTLKKISVIGNTFNRIITQLKQLYIKIFEIFTKFLRTHGCFKELLFFMIIRN